MASVWPHQRDRSGLDQPSAESLAAAATMASDKPESPETDDTPVTTARISSDVALVPAVGLSPLSAKPLSPWRCIHSWLRPSVYGPTRWWNLSEFSIQLDDPHKLHGRNDPVSGVVNLHVTRPFRVTHVVVRLQGYAQVYRRPHATGKRYDERTRCRILGAGTGTRSEPHFLGQGFISLFEAEQVICGDGRLADGEYRLRFQLKFPDTPLPTGIDFERGSIAYYVSAILTRPTAIAPTFKCERKVGFVEAVDIAELGSPKPRILSLEPARLSRNRTTQPSRRAETLDQDGDDMAAAETQEVSSVSAIESGSGSVSGLSAGRTRLQTSYSRSMQPYSEDRSGDNDADDDPTGEQRSVSDNHSSIQANPTSHESTIADGSTDGPTSSTHGLNLRRPRRSRRRARKDKKRPIVTTIELARSGYLRGDSIPLHIQVSHNKPVTSTNGVIVTLYRQARVDGSPPLLLAPAARSRCPYRCLRAWMERTRARERIKAEERRKRDERKGLDELTRMRSDSHVFRKDLAQSFASLMVNPATLTADIRTAVRVPEDAFPTIDCLPGRMITFRYFVEVVLDLNAKLTGLEHVSHSTTTAGAGGVPTISAPSTISPDTPSPTAPTNQPGVYAPVVSSSFGASHAHPFAFSGPHFVDTGPVRRNKNIVACMFEVVIGSTDSERLNASPRTLVDMRGVESGSVGSSSCTVTPSGSNRIGRPREERSAVRSLVEVEPTPRAESLDVPPPALEPPPAEPTVEPPQLSDLTEKERLRLAETILLPSAPPRWYPEDANTGQSSSSRNSRLGPAYSSGQGTSMATTPLTPAPAYSLAGNDPIGTAEARPSEAVMSGPLPPQYDPDSSTMVNPLHPSHRLPEPSAPMLDEDDDLGMFVRLDQPMTVDHLQFDLTSGWDSRLVPASHSRANVPPV